MTDLSRPDPAATKAPDPAHQTAVRNPQSAFSRVLAYRTLLIVATIVFVLDQVTKLMIAARLPFGSYGPGARIEVIRDFFYLVHVGNTGAAWSMFSGQSLGLALIAAGALAAIFYWRRSLGLRQRAVQPVFGLLCGGIVGNLVDRLRHGHVIDFIDLHFGSYVYPTFNVADSAICVGVFAYIFWSLKQPAPPAASDS
jgi:signal peptidase II